MKVQVFVITSMLAIITTPALAAVTVLDRADVPVVNDGPALEQTQQNLVLFAEGLEPNASQISQINKEYKLEYFARADWYNAWLSCLSCGMRLASITSQEEQDVVEKLIKEYNMEGDNIWVAGNDIATAGRFNWFTTRELFRYTNWAPGEPNNAFNGTEDCVEVKGTRSQMWNDVRCTVLNYYLCEKSYECF